jgi:hypothetical protein
MGGLERTGWWRIDPVTGWAADEMDDGRGTVMGDLGLQIWNLVKSSPAFHRLGACVAIVFFGVIGAWMGIGGFVMAAMSGGGLASLAAAGVALCGGALAGGSAAFFFFMCA